MSETATLEPPVASTAAPKAEAKEPKVNLPHASVGKTVLYWRIANQMTGEISASPAIVLQTAVGAGDSAFDLNVFRLGTVMSRPNVKPSDKPKAGCFTWLTTSESEPTKSTKQTKAKGA